jgi:hypothetical protein
MGFIPIIVTLGGASLLFIIVVGNYLAARRKQLDQLFEKMRGLILQSRD